jgi:pimeloyl-ACP methyl ester carboxylesterase
MPFLERGTTKLYFEREGDMLGPAVTLLNGYSRSSTDFRSLAKFLGSNGYQVIRVDNRGAGKTENAPGFSVSDMASDVVALWQECGIAQSHLLGISYGGVLSLLIASQHQALVKSLLLVSTTPSSFFLGLDNDLSSQAPDQVVANFTRYFSEKFARENPILFKSLVKETSKAFVDPVLRARSAQQRAALKVFDFTALLHAIRCPTLILHGEVDGVVTPEAADVMHRAIKQSELELVPEIGHLFLAESPKFFYDRVLKFLQRQN